MDTFQKTYPTQEEMTFRETVFMVREKWHFTRKNIIVYQDNLKIVDDHNQRYLAGAETFFTRINIFGDLTFDEFAQVVFFIFLYDWMSLLCIMD